MSQTVKFKLICCDVFMRSICPEIANTPNIADPEITPLGAHENSKSLCENIQSRIDAAEGQGYDAILLSYGLCGNSTLDIVARFVPLVIPRAHDCCTILLGSRKKFMEYFKDNLSGDWSSTGYMERSNSYLRSTDTGKLLGLDKEYDEYVRLYGEENVAFIWENLHPESNDAQLTYIETPGLEHLGYLNRFKEEANRRQKTVCVLPSSGESGNTDGSNVSKLCCSSSLISDN